MDEQEKTNQRQFKINSRKKREEKVEKDEGKGRKRWVWLVLLVTIGISMVFAIKGGGLNLKINLPSINVGGNSGGGQVKMETGGGVFGPAVYEFSK